MNKELYTQYLKNRKFDDKLINSSINDVLLMESYINNNGTTLETIAIDDIDKYIEHLNENKKNTLSTLISIGRYFYAINRNDMYIYLTSLIGGIGVYENIEKRIEYISDDKIRNNIFSNLNIPPIGSPPREYAPITEELMNRIKYNLTADKYRKALAGNNHGLPVEVYLEDKEIFKKLGDIDLFLKDYHNRSVETLKKYCQEGKIWFEQKITPEVVDFVSKNQEILSGVRDGDTIYVTKIPYQPDKYLLETDKKKKRYLACHCTLARDAIISDNHSIDYEWCYCSAGFEKFMFDVVFEENTEVEVLESALRGDSRCRFAIKIPEKYLQIVK
jgi:hypothetical protein